MILQFLNENTGQMSDLAYSDSDILNAVAVYGGVQHVRVNLGQDAGRNRYIQCIPRTELRRLIDKLQECERKFEADDAKKAIAAS